MSELNVNEIIGENVKVITNTHPEGWVANLVGIAVVNPLSVQLNMLNQNAFNDVTQNNVMAVSYNGTNLPILAGNPAIPSVNGGFLVRTY